MKITLKTWAFFILAALISFIVWYRFCYPQLAFVDHTLGREEALSVARQYLAKQGVDPSQFRTAAIFGNDDEADRYLQKTIGFNGLKQFIKAHDFDMFFWIVRFFQEHQKEEYKMTISASTGQIIAFKHVLDENAQRPPSTRDKAREMALEFLQQTYALNPAVFVITSDFERGFDNRIEYSFAWRDINIQIPWDLDKNKGTGKLLMGASVSGEEFILFYKSNFVVPDQFKRYLTEIKNAGQNLGLMFRIFYTLLLTSAIFFIIIRRNHLAMHCTKKFYLALTGIFFGLLILSLVNDFQMFLFEFDTALPYGDTLGRYVIGALLSFLFISLTMIVPGLAGELLRFENREPEENSFLHYVHSTFFSRSVARAILLGYLCCVILLGIQAVLFKIGERYWGVWVEYNWMTRLSSTTWPFLAALTVGFKASCSEEIMYRIFAINLGKKFFKNTLLAVVISSIIWGFGHSSYPIFPSWFRGVEVTCLGLFLSFVYLRFGIIPVVVAHFLFDVFWHASSYLLGPSQPFDFYSSLIVILLPLFWAMIAFLFNKEEVMRPLRWLLSNHQQFNLEVLRSYLSQNPQFTTQKSSAQIRKELSEHGWDVAVIDIALEDIKK
jgi:hypothetical protein